ncbi:hypothetical protein E3U25_06520 (plasmid) [Paracoccus versutus]|nr:hypothetical protein [Paracoccus sp. pheM1]MBT0780588.1 hypothetical protein [Paracoccus sp. pheM1]WGR55630.1 hypothetical protein E3U25_06520 [Paracoccus versutus]
MIAAALAFVSPMVTFGGAAFWFGGQDQKIATHETRISENSANIAQISERVRTLEINAGRADERLLLILDSVRKIEAKLERSAP